MSPRLGTHKERLRWHCRRGMLELDLVLSAFVERHLERLDATEVAAFEALLAKPDPELLDLVMGRDEAALGECERGLVALMRDEPCGKLTDTLPDRSATPTPSPNEGVGALSFPTGRGEIRGANG